MNINRNIIIVLIIFLVALFPFDPGGGNWFYWSAFTVGASLLLFITLKSQFVSQRNEIHIPKYSLPLLLFSAWALLSYYWSLSPYISLLYLGNYFAALTVGFCIFLIRPQFDQIEKIINGIIVVGLVYAITGFIQFLTGGSGINIGHGFGRARAFFVWPNTYAGFLNLILFPSLVFYFYKKRMFNRYLFFALVFYIGLMTTYSRGGFLAFLFSFLLAVIIGLRKKKIPLQKVGISAVGFALVTLVFMNIPGAGFFDRAVTLTYIDDPSQISPGRVGHWKVALKGWELHPIKGAGIESYQFLSRQLDHRYEKDFWYHAHNDYVQILSELGVIGIALYLSIIVAVIIAFYKISKDAKLDREFFIYFGLFLGIVTFFVHEVVDYHFYIPGTLLVAIIYISIIISSRNLSTFSIHLPVITDKKYTFGLHFSQPIRNILFSGIALFLVFWLSQPAIAQYFSTRAKKELKAQQVVKALRDAERAENFFHKNVFYSMQVADYENGFAFIERDSTKKAALLNDMTSRYLNVLNKEKWNPALWTHFGNFALTHSGYFGSDSALSIAENAYKKALQCLPDYTRLNLQLAAINLQQNKITSAESNLSIFTTKHPNAFDGVELHTKLLYKTKQYGQLFALINKLDGENKLAGLGHYYKGRVYQDQNDFSNAKHEYNLAIDYGYKLADSNYRLASIFSNEKKKEIAQHYFKIADSLGFSNAATGDL